MARDKTEEEAAAVANVSTAGRSEPKPEPKFAEGASDAVQRHLRTFSLARLDDRFAAAPLLKAR